MLNHWESNNNATYTIYGIVATYVYNIYVTQNIISTHLFKASRFRCKSTSENDNGRTIVVAKLPNNHWNIGSEYIPVCITL